MDSNSKNEFIRKKIADKLTSLLESGTVLDFGGGTGQDLNWLLNSNYKIIFCEPSPSMRQIASDKSNIQFPNATIHFLKDAETDFNTWDKKLPFQEKVAAVIANFAVLNCIATIDLFFKQLALVTASNATIILLVLDISFTKRLKINAFETIKYLFTRKHMNLRTKFGKEYQMVYLHSIESIKNASLNYFEFIEAEQLKEYSFSIIHLIRK